MRPLVVLCLLATNAAADIGAAAPIGRMEAAPNGRWFAMCQARIDTNGDGALEAGFDLHFPHGDKMRRYLVLGDGPGEVIDFVGASSAHGEWVAIVRGGKLELIDAATFKRWPLVADTRDDNYRGWSGDGTARFVSIAGNGTRMTYLRRSAIVIRDLATHAERVVPIKDKLWRVEVDAAGRWAEVRVIRNDTDRDGKRDWPGGVGEGYVRGCDADLVHYHNPTGDDAHTLWLDLATGTLVDDPTVIRPVGDELLRKRADGALLLGKLEIAEPACNAEVGDSLAVPPRVEITCNGKRPGIVVGPGFRRELSRELYYSADWFRRDGNARFLHGTHYVLDLATGDELELPGTEVQHDEHVFLVQTKTGYAVFDALARTTRPLVSRGSHESTYTKWLANIGGTIYDLRTGKPIASNYPIVMTDDFGRVLVIAGRKGAPANFTHGPLRWL